MPATLVELLEIPGVGPKTVRLLWERLGIETLEDLRTALRAGTLRGAPGLTDKGIAGLQAGLEALERRSTRMTLGTAERIAAGVIALLEDVPGVRSIVPAGSFRRRRETIGDLDLLVETDDPAAVIARFTSLPAVESVVNAGTHKASIRLVGGPQVDLMVMPPGEAGAYLVHFTGSKEHNVRLRALARDRGWSLSEKGFVRLGDDGEPATGRRRRAAHLRRPRRTSTASSACRTFRPSCARTAARSRPPGTDGCRGSSSRATCAATSMPTRTGPTASTPSSRWRRRPAPAATSTSSSPTIPTASPSRAG